MTELRTALQRATRVLPRTDVDFEGLSKRRERKHRNRRILAGVVALVVAASGTLAAFAAFGRPGEPLPAGLDESQFAALWPEAAYRPATEAQDRVDAGSDAWRLDPSATAKRFGEEALLWTDVAVSPCEPQQNAVCLAHPTEGSPRVVYVRGGVSDTFCHVAPCSATATVWLGQPLRTGATGAWSVVKVETDEGGWRSGLEPGETVEVPAELEIPSNIGGPLQVVTEYGWNQGDCGRSSLSSPQLAGDDAAVTVHLAPRELACEETQEQNGGLQHPASGWFSVAWFGIGVEPASIFGPAPDQYPASRGTDPVLALGAVAVRFVPAGSEPSPEPSPPPSPMGTIVEPTITRQAYGPGLQASCLADGIRVDETRVTTQPNGLGMVIDNQTDVDQWVAFDGAGSGPTIAPGVHETLISIAPGEHTVQCFPVDSYRQDGVGFSLVDPDGYWVPYDLQCAEPGPYPWTHGDPAPGWGGYDAEPEEVFQQQFGQYVRSGDLVERASYVADREQPWIRVVRDSKVVFVTNFRNYGDGYWDIGDYQGCNEFFAS
jgi:hypothetical protein